MENNSRYELRFANALISSVRPGDCVWDVGANIGVFTRQLAERVGPSGRVIAVEPFRSTFERLLTETRHLPQVSCLPVALAAAENTLCVNGTPESPWNTLASQCAAGQGEVVHTTTGTSLIAAGQPAPDVIKIDVEGFEEEVIWGFRETLAASHCSAIFIEIHYGQLERRGFLRAPARIQSLLRDIGFRLQWIDTGHLKASRPRKELR